MINYDSILSIFNDKGTLLKYLKKVENALKTSVLTKCEVLRGEDNYFAFKFNFADDTSITTEYVKIDADLQATNLQNYINGSDTIVVDLNELQTALVVKLDEEYKKTLASQTDVENLSKRVDNHYTLINKLEENIAAKQSKITNSVDIVVKEDNKLYISDAVTKVTTDLKAQADTNTTNITTLTSDNDTNKTNIATNTSDITSLKSSKQDTLTSGTNIKTINGESVLGSGDLTISGGGGTKLYQHIFTPEDDRFTISIISTKNKYTSLTDIYNDYEIINAYISFLDGRTGSLQVCYGDVIKLDNELYMVYSYFSTATSLVQTYLSITIDSTFNENVTEL